jgi:carbon monoxide dehydrogenase subunit G
MKLENQFVVDAPVDRTWATLLDIRRVAQCLPGAELESDGSDGVYRGSMSVKLGPMSLSYKGTARMAEVEEDAHSATIEVKAKELKGQGTASARIRNRLGPGPDGATEVKVETDLNITGRPAQFGRGIMEDVAGKMLEDFAKRLEGEVLGGSGAAANGTGGAATAQPSPAPPATDPSSGPSATAPPPGDSPPPAELDLGSVILGPVVKRAAIALAALVGAELLRRLLRPGRRGLSVTVKWR